MNSVLAFGLGTQEIVLILLIVFLLFGAKKLPELARGIGRSLGEFKKAKNDFESELLNSDQEQTPKPSAPPVNTVSTEQKVESPKQDQSTASTDYPTKES